MSDQNSYPLTDLSQILIGKLRGIKGMFLAWPNTSKLSWSTFKKKAPSRAGFPSSIERTYK